MATEIERKFLVAGDEWKRDAAGRALRQGYLSVAKERVVRVRIDGPRGWLTIKGPTENTLRAEFEYEIPLEDAQVMLDTLCERPVLDKTRYRVPFAGSVWEIDEFHGANEGLVVAEIELPSIEHRFVRPAWLGREISDDARYFNSNLIAHPYHTWREAGAGT